MFWHCFVGVLALKKVVISTNVRNSNQIKDESVYFLLSTLL